MFSIIQEDELITLIIGSFVLLFIIMKRSNLKIIPFSGVLIFAYYLVFCGWILTILESFFFEKTLNILEHFCYMASIGTLTFWCYQFFNRQRKEE